MEPKARMVEVMGFVDRGDKGFVFEFCWTGTFHAFGIDYEPDQRTKKLRAYTAAVIEKPDGKVVLIKAEYIRFIT